MNIMTEKALSELRTVMKRPHGGITTFTPTNPQADMIRLSLMKHWECREQNGGVWFNTHKRIWKHKDATNTWAPILVKHREGHWLFLTHHILPPLKDCAIRARNDLYAVQPPKHMIYVDYEGFVIPEEYFEFNALGELIGGRWKIAPIDK